MTIQTFEMGSIGTNCYVVYNEKGNCAIVDCDRSEERRVGKEC